MVRITPFTRVIKGPGNPLTGARNLASFAMYALRALQSAPAYQSGSVAGTVLYNLYNKTKASGSKFSRAKKNLLKKYTEKALAKIHTRNMKNAANMDKEMDKLTSGFAKDYNMFLTEYNVLFDAIANTIEVAQADHYEGLTSFKQILKEVDGIAKLDAADPKKRKLYFPKPALDKFDREFKIAMRDLSDQLQKEYVEVKRLSTGRRYALGYLARFARKRSSENKEMKAIGILEKDITSFKTAGQTIKTQIQNGIKQNFIAYLLDYIYKLEKLDNTLKNLKTDIERIMQKVLEEAQETLEKIYPFLKIIQADLGHTVTAAMKTNSDRLKAHHESIMKKLEQEAWVVYELDEAEDIVEIGKDLINILREDISETMKHAAQEARGEHFVQPE